MPLRRSWKPPFKEDVSVYFDENPHDRLQETHNVEQKPGGEIEMPDIYAYPLTDLSRIHNSYAWQV